MMPGRERERERDEERRERERKRNTHTQRERDRESTGGERERASEGRRRANRGRERDGRLFVFLEPGVNPRPPRCRLGWKAAGEAQGQSGERTWVRQAPKQKVISTSRASNIRRTEQK